MKTPRRTDPRVNCVPGRTAAHTYADLPRCLMALDAAGRFRAGFSRRPVQPSGAACTRVGGFLVRLDSRLSRAIPCPAETWFLCKRGRSPNRPAAASNFPNKTGCTASNHHTTPTFAAGPSQPGPRRADPREEGARNGVWRYRDSRARSLVDCRQDGAGKLLILDGHIYRLGRDTCKRRRPQCGMDCLRDECLYRREYPKGSRPRQ